MLGTGQGSQDRLFYEFDLDEVVPSDHLLRRIDAVLDLDWLRGELRPFYSHTGRPSVCPELMVRMLVIGYCFGVRSERRLCDEVRLNLAYRWFCRLGIEDRVPDHSTFSVNRLGRFREGDVFRRVFENVVRRCMDAGLVGGEGFAVDASVIEADASRFQRVDGAEVDWTDAQRASRPVREYLAALNGDNPPTNPRQKPKAMSPSDPAAAWTTRGRHKVMFGYSLNYLINTESAVIVDMEATPTRISKEVEATGTMIERTRERLGVKPRRIAGDVAYGTGKLLGWLVDRGIDPHIPVWDKGRRDDFTYDDGADAYVCPRGKTLRTTGRVHDGKALLYRSRKADCRDCPLKSRCCPNTTTRKIPRDVNEAARDHVRGLMGTEDYETSAKLRKKVETLFGEAKRNLGFTRLRLRGLAGAADEFLLTAVVQNLKRLAKHATGPPIGPQTA
ncbi:MAG: IS1182 family transposase [Rhodospirillaceae bacterium]